MKFLKNKDISLVNGGYLVTTNEETPINHKEFVAKQREVHSLILLAKKVKVTDFTIKKPVSFAALLAETSQEINTLEQKQFVAVPTAPELSMTADLQKEAMSWLKFEKTKNVTEKINRLLQNFNILNEFEEFGLYFSEDSIVKLTKIYSMNEVVEAIKVLEPHLD